MESKDAIYLDLSRHLVLLIQVDALRYDYISQDNSPFLWQLSQQGIYGVLQPTFGFEPDAAYLAGLYPDECDGGTHYWYEPDAAPFSFVRHLPDFLDRLSPRIKKLFRKLLTECVRATTQYKYESVFNIPLNVLPYVCPAHKYLPHEPGYLEKPCIFSLCDEHNIRTFIHASPLHPVRITVGSERLKRELRPPIRFAFWHIGDLDMMGHRYGPNSGECKAAIRKVDDGIAKILLYLKNRYEQIHCIIIGDHGMAKVEGISDVQKSLNDAGIKRGKGVLYFLDSTIARFWFSDDRVKSLVIDVLQKLDGGKILRSEDRDQYHLNYSHNRFGDLFFLADPGVLILPNFYQDNVPVKGMHGYAPEFSEQHSAFVIHSPCIYTPQKIDHPVDMRRIFPTCLNFLGLQKPEQCLVESIV